MEVEGIDLHGYPSLGSSIVIVRFLKTGYADFLLY